MLNIFFPKLCSACNSELVTGERILCGYCRHHLPLTHFHQNKSNTLNSRFYGRIILQNATALLYFSKNNLAQKLIHSLKYKGNVEIGAFLGEWLGQELAVCREYQSVDAVIPVPLHPKKLRKRGYNQVAGFARKLAESLQAEYIDDVLVKATHTKSQVFSGRISRVFNQEEVFAVKSPEKIAGKHLLLTDDIITTGATLESCACQLQQAQGVNLSIAAMALTE